MASHWDQVHSYPHGDPDLAGDVDLNKVKTLIGMHFYQLLSRVQGRSQGRCSSTPI